MIFSESEKDFIRENFKAMSYHVLADKIHERFGTTKNVNQIKHFLGKEGLRRVFPFSQEEQDLIIEHYGDWTIKRILKEIQKRFGVTRHPTSITKFAHERGLSFRENASGIDIVLLADEVGVAPYTLNALIVRRKLKHKKVSNLITVSEEVADWIRTFYAPPPWPSLTTERASELLGLSQDSVRLLVKKGRISGHRRGRDMYVKAEDVFSEMRRRGMVPPLTYAS